MYESSARVSGRLEVGFHSSAECSSPWRRERVPGHKVDSICKRCSYEDSIESAVAKKEI